MKTVNISSFLFQEIRKCKCEFIFCWWVYSFNQKVFKYFST